jgi:hypothetical protein
MVGGVFSELSSMISCSVVFVAGEKIGDGDTPVPTLTTGLVTAEQGALSVDAGVLRRCEAEKDLIESGRLDISVFLDGRLDIHPSWVRRDGQSFVDIVGFVGPVRLPFPLCRLVKNRVAVMSRTRFFRL